MSDGIFDHLVVAGETLAGAADHVEALLGLPTVDGGAHEAMGTHNRLLSLGPGDYLEAIAVDPAAPAPGCARWFGLDGFGGAPRLVGWALRVRDLDAAIVAANDGVGEPLTLRRGPFRWRISHPAGGITPYGGLCPALIEWQEPHPAPDLPDAGARLVSLTLTHPRAGALGWTLSQLTEDDRIVIREGPPGLSAVIHTADGEKVLR